MANKPMDSDFRYDPSILATRIEDLRKDDGVNGLTFKQLSKRIMEKTGVSISAMQLSKYENADLKQRMNINNLLALADYYDVSIDYLIGRSESKSNDTTDQYISSKFGLSDDAMKMLERLKIYTGGFRPRNAHSLLNPILENNAIIELLWAIRKHVWSFNHNHYGIDSENPEVLEALANTFNCEPKDLRKYIEISSQSLIESIIMKIVNDIK